MWKPEPRNLLSTIPLTVANKNANKLFQHNFYIKNYRGIRCCGTWVVIETLTASWHCPSLVHKNLTWEKERIGKQLNQTIAIEKRVCLMSLKKVSITWDEKKSLIFSCKEIIVDSDWTCERAITFSYSLNVGAFQWNQTNRW